MTNVFFFLFIWYLLYLKVQGLEEVKDIVNLTVLFKIGATMVIIGGIAGVEVAGSGLNTILHFSSGNPSSILSNFSKIYPKVLAILLLLGVWKPTIYKKTIPKLFDLLKWLEGKSVYLIKWK